MISPVKFASRFLVWFFLCAASPAAEDPLFPLPAELEPDVDFWVAVFSEYSSDEGVLHDNRRLGVVYEVLAIPAETSRRERSQRIRERREHYRAILQALAGGKRNGLSAEERRVLGLWGDEVTNAELGAAAGRIRFQQGLADRFREGLERAGRWRTHVHNTFARLGVPLELSALPHVESSYNPDARSHVGASGIWQFTRGTGRRFMRIDHVIDERNDPYAATVAAGELLAYNYSILGNWPMAITAYNHGLAGARRAMRQYGDDIARIFREYRGRTFGFASRNFYLAFLAAMRIDKNPQAYFPGVTPAPPLVYERALLPGYIPAAELSAALGLAEREIARHNPALQATIWQGSKHLPSGYELRVPGGSLPAALDRVLASIDASAWQDEQLPDLFHTVARGDTLSEIADRYDTGVSTLVALNGLGSRHRIRAGQRLRLPAAGPAPAAVAATPAAPSADIVAADTAVASLPPDEPAVLESAGALPDTAETDEEGMMAAVRTSLLSDPSDYTVADDGTIEVHPLETLGHYADWLEIRTQRLRDINGLAFRTPVEVGRRLKLDFDRVDRRAFEERRAAYQQRQQDAFFREHTIRGVAEHVVRRGESVWVLALRRYDVPLWLFRQYNPQLDMHNVKPGTRVRLPILTAVDADA